MAGNDLEDAALTPPRVRSVFQPLVDLDSGDTVGYEALARSAEDTTISPLAMLQDAARQGRLAEFDAQCRQSAMTAVTQAGPPDYLQWFLNTEPISFTRRTGAEPMTGHLQVVWEITERALARYPRTLMDAAAQAHARGELLALDDVGARPDSLALLPLIRPDVVKLDISVIHDPLRRESSLVADTVRAYAYQTGALVLAEGIETEEHVMVARVCGATHGQGYYFGRPAPLPTTWPGGQTRMIAPSRGDEELRNTPFGLISAHHDLHLGSKQLLLDISRQLEWTATEAGSSQVLLISLENSDNWTPVTRDRYVELAQHGVFVAAVALDATSMSAPGIRTSSLSRTDPLVDEWNVILLGPRHAVALSARDLGDVENDPLRRFAYAITYDRTLVVDMARALFSRTDEHIDDSEHFRHWTH